MDSTPSQQDGLRLVNEPRHLVRGTVRDLHDIWRHREILRALVARELRSRYKGAVLGWAWALVRPLVMLLIYGLAVGIFLGAERVIPQFMIFIYSGLLAWNLFSVLITGSINVVVQNGPLLARANFPTLLLPMAVAIAALVDFALQASVITVGYVIYADWPSVSELIWLAPTLPVLVLTGLGVGLVLSALNVFWRDIGFFSDVALQVGFWMTPILYSYGQVVNGLHSMGLPTRLFADIYMANPMASVVIGFQKALWPASASAQASSHAFPSHLEARILIWSGLSFVLAWLGMRIFVRMSGNFAQEF